MRTILAIALAASLVATTVIVSPVASYPALATQQFDSSLAGAGARFRGDSIEVSARRRTIGRNRSSITTCLCPRHAPAGRSRAGRARYGHGSTRNEMPNLPPNLGIGVGVGL